MNEFEFEFFGTLFSESLEKVACVQYLVSEDIYYFKLEDTFTEIPEVVFLVTHSKSETLRIRVSQCEEGEEAEFCDLVGKRESSLKNNSRNDIRVSVSLETEIELNGETEKHRATVTDISAGGIRIVSDLELVVGKSFWIKFPFFPDSTKVRAIIRSKLPVSRSGKVAYGCEFENVNSGMKDKIRGFVFQQQVKNRKSRRG